MPKTKRETAKKPTAGKTTKKASKPVDKTKVVKDLAKKLLSELGIDVKLEISEGEDKSLLVQLETEEPGIIIGFHGETLSSIQLILGMMAYRQIGEWTRVLVNVNDYRERRQESLEKIALSAAERAKASGEPQDLSPMNSGERRIIHLILASDSEVETESEGEGWQRHVVIRLKKD